MADAGRANQKRRTRKDLLRAAARLMNEGGHPTLEEIAAEAMVSRATAYRYFPGLDALLLEAALDVEAPDETELFDSFPSADPVRRVERVDEAFEAMIDANEPALRAMLVHSLQRGPDGDGAMPARQNRRSPLIEAALAPARELDPGSTTLLARALALVIGTESRIVLKDVLRLSAPEAAAVKAFAIRALIEAARKTPA